MFSWGVEKNMETKGGLIGLSDKQREEKEDKVG